MQYLPRTPLGPSRWLAYGFLDLSMALVGSYVALSKPLVAVLSWLLLKERIGVRVWLAVVCSMVDIGVIALSKQEISTHQTCARGQFSLYK